MTKLTIDNWEFESDPTNDRIIIRSLDTNEEYYLNEDGTTNLDADTVDGQEASEFVDVAGDILTGNLDFDQNEAEQLVLDQVAGNPTTPVTGQMWYDTNED